MSMRRKETRGGQGTNLTLPQLPPLPAGPVTPTTTTSPVTPPTPPPPPPPVAAPDPATPPGGDGGIGAVAPVFPVLPPGVDGGVYRPASVQPGTRGITPYRTASFSPGRLLGGGKSVDDRNIFGPGIGNMSKRRLDRDDDPRRSAIMSALFGGRR